MPLLDAFIEAHAGDSALRIRTLVEIQFAAGTVRWALSDVPIVALSNTWTPKPVVLSSLTDVSASLSFSDADGLISAYVLGATSPVQTLVIIRQAWLTSGAANVIAGGTRVIFRGRIASARVERSGPQMRGTFTCGPDVDLSQRRVPRLWMSPKCPYVFKDPLTCASDGTATSCEHTLDACSNPDKRTGAPAGGNRDRFGGEPYLPPDGKVIERGDGKFTVHTAPRKTIGA